MWDISWESAKKSKRMVTLCGLEVMADVSVMEGKGLGGARDTEQNRNTLKGGMPAN